MKRKSSKELSEKDFAWFQEEVKYWLRFFGCFEWDPRFLFEEDDEALALVQFKKEQGIAAFTLAKVWEKDPITPYSISKVAFHETCEVLLGTLGNLAAITVSEPKVEEETHRIIRKLENTVFEYEWKRRFPKRL